MWQPAPVVIAPRVIAVTTTIAAAMAEARAGDTVEVPEGEYREQVRLKDGVTLRARVPREPKLRAAPMSSGPAVIAEGVKGARFSGFRILADPQMPLSVGILLRDSAVEIDDVEVKGAGVGIEIRGSAQPRAARQCDPRLPGGRRADPGTGRAVALAQSDPGEQGRGRGGARRRQALAAGQHVRPQRAGTRPPRTRSRSSTSSWHRFAHRPAGSHRAAGGESAEPMDRRVADQLCRDDRPGGLSYMIAPASRKIGKYEIVRKLGRGGMADVYLANDTETGDTVALKLIEHAADADTIAAIEAERRGAELQARLAAIDPRVVRVYGCGRRRRLLLRRHGVHRRAGSGGIDAPRPARPRLRHRSRHRRGQDAG